MFALFIVLRYHSKGEDFKYPFKLELTRLLLEKVALRRAEKKVGMQSEKRGEKRGEKKGEKLALQKTAVKMKADGLPFETIQRYTGLSKAEIEAL